MFLQGIKQHSPGAYVLNNTVPKHHLNAAPGTTIATKTDGMNPSSDALVVRFSSPHQYTKISLLTFFCVEIYHLTNDAAL